MRPFSATLSNGATLTGIHNIPARGESPAKHRPLVVGLHGSTYDCRYFDADAAHTAALASSALGVPFVSIDRPCCGGTSSFLPIPEGSDFPRETGVWLHRFILPALWHEFGIPNHCNCVVLQCHSLGAMGGIAAAAIHGQDDGPLYPLGGIIVSGIGESLLSNMKENPVREPNFSSEYVLFPLDAKDNLMFRPGTAPPEVLQASEHLNSPTPFVEIESLRNVWIPTWRNEWAPNVVAPLMVGMSEQDCFFEGTEEHLSSFLAAFSNSVRVDGSLLKNAPHCLELSYWSQGWYARCFGFAMECSASLAVQA